MDNKDANLNISEEQEKVYDNNGGKKEENENTVSIILVVLGFFVIIASFIVGISFGGDSYRFNWTIALIYWMMGLFSGMIFIGFGEVIKLLQHISNNTKKEKDTVKKNISKVVDKNLVKINKLKLIEGNDVKCFAKKDNNTWLCVCGTSNPYDNNKSIQNCKSCGRNRDYVLEKLTEEKFNSSNE